jgi:NTE family protein
MASSEGRSIPRVALVLSGGIGLGAYQAGVYEALHQRENLNLNCIAASSVGAVNAALIAGAPRERRLEALRAFWTSPPFGSAVLSGTNIGGPWGHAQNWISVLQARLFGAWGHFHPRLATWALEDFASLYDLSPMRRRIEKLVDFERLNRGEIRVCVATTDIETGDLVIFDTAKEMNVRIEHLLASCGFLPEFAPVNIDGRLLGDGGLCANAPFEPVLAEEQNHREWTFVVDLYARDGGRPSGLESALARKNDLLFGNQTYTRLRAVQRERELRDEIARLTKPNAASAAPRKPIFYLSYRAPPEEAGPEKPFDLSRASIEHRWREGKLDMQEALRRMDGHAASDQSLIVIRRRCERELGAR